MGLYQANLFSLITYEETKNVSIKGVTVLTRTDRGAKTQEVSVSIPKKISFRWLSFNHAPF